MSSPEAIIAQASQLLADVKSEALQAADKLESLASTPYQIWVNFPTVEAVELSKVPAIAGTEDLPTLERVAIDLSTVSAFDPNSFKQATYVSPFFAFLEPQLIDFIQNGGPGISQSVQDAIFNETRERDLQILRDKLDVVRSNYGKTGFPIPTSMLRAQESVHVTEYGQARETTNYKITQLIAERAQDTMKSAVTAGIRMEEVQSQFSLGFAKLFIDVSNQLIAQYRLLQDAAIAEFEGQIKALLARVQVGEVNARLDLAYQEQLLKQWEVDTTASVERTKASIAQAVSNTEVKLKAAQSLSELYKSMVAGVAGQVSGISLQTEDISQD